MTLISKARLEDIDARNKTLECMAIALRQYARDGDQKWFEYAKDFGKTSRIFQEKIEHGDYTQRDADIERVEQLLKRWP